MKARSPTIAKSLLLLLVFGLPVTLSSYGIGLAQNIEARELEDTTPKHLPIKIKIREEKEKAFKDLRNEHWLSDLEIEVKNIGDKPIYFLGFVINIPENITPSGSMYGIISGENHIVRKRDGTLIFLPSATLPAKTASVSITKLGVWPCEGSPARQQLTSAFLKEVSL